MGRRRIEGSATASSAATPTTVPVTSVACNPRNPRDDYDDVAELAQSMEQVGVLQPLGVVRYELYLARYPEHETQIGAAHWVVMHGNRRLAAATKAGLHEVPVIVHERLARGDSFDESILIENVHRKDLSPLREAALLQELIDKHGSGRKVATAVGKTSGWVTQRLSLLKLVPQLQSKLAAGELTIVAARELAQIASTRQLEAFENGGPPYRDPSKPQPTPAAPTVVAGDPATYVRTELEPEGAYAVSTSAVPAPPVEKGRENGQGAYAVSTHGRGSDAEPSSVQRDRGDDGLISLLRGASPNDLVQAIRGAYSSEQCVEIGRQLQI